MKRNYKTVGNGNGTRLEIGPGESLSVGQEGRKVIVRGNGMEMAFSSWKDLVSAIDVSRSFYCKSDRPEGGKVGECVVDPEGVVLTLRKEYYRQGWIFKDPYAFYYEPEKPCYVPELSEKIYTREDFLKLCKGQEKIAEKVFEAVDWQQPETYLDEQFQEGEMEVCRCCGNIFISYDVDRCPYCGAERK